jgi:hypothetical protein
MGRIETIRNELITLFQGISTVKNKNVLPGYVDIDELNEDRIICVLYGGDSLFMIEDSHYFGINISDISFGIFCHVRVNTDARNRGILIDELLDLRDKIKAKLFNPAAGGRTNHVPLSNVRNIVKFECLPVPDWKNNRGTLVIRLDMKWKETEVDS